MSTPQKTPDLRAEPGRADITVQLDGAPHRLPAHTTLADLVEKIGHDAHAVSTAVNGEFVARAQRASRVLAEGDQVLLFQPIVGG